MQLLIELPGLVSAKYNKGKRWSSDGVAME